MRMMTISLVCLLAEANFGFSIVATQGMLTLQFDIYRINVNFVNLFAIISCILGFILFRF